MTLGQETRRPLPLQGARNESLTTRLTIMTLNIVVDVQQCDRRTKRNWTKTAHNTHTRTLRALKKKHRKWTCIVPNVSITRPLSAQMWITPIHTLVEHWAYWRPQLVVAEWLANHRIGNNNKNIRPTGPHYCDGSGLKISTNSNQLNDIFFSL